MKNKESTIKKTIRANIIAKRKELNLRQEDLGEKVGFAKTTVASWEQGLSSPDIDTIIKLLQIFDMSFSEFTGYDDKQ